MDQPLRDEYFEKHLPYRTRIMLTHLKMVQGGERSGPLEACVEASVITGRMYLNVLGVKRDTKTDKLERANPRADDVNAEQLGGSLLDINALPPDDKRLFERFLRMADKACAHLTLPEQHDWADTHEAIRRICKYVKKHLYAPTSRRSLEIDALLETFPESTLLVNTNSTDTTVASSAGGSLPQTP